MTKGITFPHTMQTGKLAGRHFETDGEYKRALREAEQAAANANGQGPGGNGQNPAPVQEANAVPVERDSYGYPKVAKRGKLAGRYFESLRDYENALREYNREHGDAPPKRPRRKRGTNTERDSSRMRFPRTMQYGKLAGRHFETLKDYEQALFEINARLIGAPPAAKGAPVLLGVEHRFTLTLTSGTLESSVTGDPRSEADVVMAISLLNAGNGRA